MQEGRGQEVRGECASPPEMAGTSLSALAVSHLGCYGMSISEQFSERWKDVSIPAKNPGLLVAALDVRSGQSKAATKRPGEFWG